MEGPDSGHVVANAVCRREVASEVSDEQAHGGDVWTDEAEMVIITELDESLGGRREQLGVELPS